MSIDIKGTLLNPAWRLANLYDVIDKTSQRVHFTPNGIQKRIIEATDNRKMILKARQFGVSTVEIIRLADDAFFTPNVTNVILAHEQDAIKKLFRIARRAWEFLPDGWQPELDRGGGSMYEMYFPKINSRLYCDLESRGDTIHRLHVSEAAFMKNPQKLIATMQAVPMSGHVTIETTPNGMGNFFYDWWTDPTSPYSKLFFPWFMHAEYRLPTHGKKIALTPEEKDVVRKAKSYGVKLDDEQIMFRRMKVSELRDLFQQEYPEDDQSCFLATGSAAMDLRVVKQKLDESAEPIEDDGNLRIWKEYDKRERYVVGADTAEGVQGDYSTASVFCVRTREQVATLRGRFKPYDFAHRLHALCEMYQSGGQMHPVLAVEANNHGHAVLLELKENLHYPNLYFHKDDRVGWLTDRVTRPIMLDDFIDGVENGTVTLNDRDTLSECLTLVVNDGKIEAAQGKHDDCVIAAAIGVQMLVQSRQLDVYDDIRSRILV